MKHTKKQTKALWESAEHWLENWENPATAKIYGKDCPCCKEFIKTSSSILVACGKCPIAQWSGQALCKGTPWMRAQYEQQWPVTESILEAFASEYRFLVCLALGEAPDPDLVEDFEKEED